MEPERKTWKRERQCSTAKRTLNHPVQFNEYLINNCVLSTANVYPNWPHICPLICKIFIFSKIFIWLGTGTKLDISRYISICPFQYTIDNIHNINQWQQDFPHQMLLKVFLVKHMLHRMIKTLDSLFLSTVGLCGKSATYHSTNTLTLFPT